jgi:hypothetical protein
MARLTSVYLAARYTRKEEMRDYRDQLHVRGITVTSSWLDEPEPANVTLKKVSKKKRRRYAGRDVEDIGRARAIVFFSEQGDTPRGGRHVEFGIAVAIRLAQSVCTPKSELYRIIVIGQEENIFHYLPFVEVYPSWEDFLELVANEALTPREVASV